MHNLFEVVSIPLFFGMLDERRNILCFNLNRLILCLKRNFPHFLSFSKKI